MYAEIIAQQNQLRRLVEHATELQENDDIDIEIKSGFVSFLCVRISVYVESSVKIILREYVRSRTGNRPYIANFVNRHLNVTINPRRSRILDLFERFNPIWMHNLDSFIVGELDNSLGAVVSNRNNIAHGENVVMTATEVHKYFNDVQHIVEFIYEMCEPTAQQAVD